MKNVSIRVFSTRLNKQMDMVFNEHNTEMRTLKYCMRHKGHSEQGYLPGTSSMTSIIN